MKWFKNRIKTETEIETPLSDEWDREVSYAPMEVVRDEDGAPDPAVDESWDDATKLRWQAGLLKYETGFAVTFYQPASGRNDKVDWTAFGVVAPQGTHAFSAIRVNDFYLFAVGARWGIEWARAQDQE